MPAAFSSRSRRRRHTSLDAIEEDRPTQNGAGEDLDENEAKEVKLTRPAKKRTQISEPDPREEEEEDQAFPDILANFQDQPLGKAELRGLAGVAEDWGMFRRIHANFVGLMHDVGANVAEFAEGEKGEKALVEVDSTMKKLLDTNQELILHQETLQDMVQMLSREEHISDVTRYYETTAEKKISQSKGRTTRQKYAKSEEYRKFRQTIFEVLHPDEAMPPVTDLLPREGGDLSDDEDEVEVGGVTQDYKCPITLTILEDPLTSSVCNHSYSAKAIMEYLGQKPVVKCPATGCRSMVSRASLQPNKALAKRAKDAARRERARNESDEDSDGEEVIE